jgi:4-carboxymuconolactone decarboxylase
VGQHVPLARRAGVIDVELRRLACGGAGVTDGWSEADSTLLELTDAILDGTSVDAELWEALKRGRSEPQLLELLMLPGFYRMLAGFINALGIELDEGLPHWPSTGVAGSESATAVPGEDERPLP